MDMLNLQEKFISEMLKGINRPWDSIKVHYENCEVNGEISEMNTARLQSSDGEHDFDLSLDAMDCLVELKNHLPQGQSEPWTWVEFFIDKMGRYKFDYKYGLPPLTSDYLKMQAG